MIKALKSGEMFDVLVVGAGCTGAGAALDAATRGLKTACIERGDFANEDIEPQQQAYLGRV